MRPQPCAADRVVSFRQASRSVAPGDIVGGMSPPTHAALLTTVLVTLVSGCNSGPKRTCEEAGKNYVEVKFTNAPDKKRRIDEFVSKCNEQKPSQKAIDCVGNAKTKDELNDCPSK